MKTFRLSILFALSAAATVSATAQTRPATSTATRTTAKPATTAAKPAATATKSAGSAASKSTPAKPAGTASKAATTTAKPAPKPAATVVAEEATPAKTTAAKSTAPKAQTTGGKEFGVGSTALNLGVGFGLGYSYGLFNGIRSTPALTVAVDRGITDNVGPGVISVGGLVGYQSSSWGSGGYKASIRNFVVAARGAYHYNVFQNPKLDTYAGLSLGVRVESYSTNYDLYGSSYGGTSLTSGIFLGSRYMFTNNIGAFGELGYDMSLLKVGLTARF